MHIDNESKFFVHEHIPVLEPLCHKIHQTYHFIRCAFCLHQVLCIHVAGEKLLKKNNKI